MGYWKWLSKIALSPEVEFVVGIITMFSSGVYGVVTYDLVAVLPFTVGFIFASHAHYKTFNKK